MINNSWKKVHKIKKIRSKIFLKLIYRIFQILYYEFFLKKNYFFKFLQNKKLTKLVSFFYFKKMVTTTGQELNQNSKNKIIQSIKKVIQFILQSPEEFKVLNEKVKIFSEKLKKLDFNYKK